MKRLFISAVVIFFLAPGHGQLQKNADDFKKLFWVEGTWKRTNAKPGISGNERWIKISETELQGFGLTMKAEDTVEVEKLKLIIKGGDIFYVADVPENKEPVYFKLTEISEKAFSCENPQHDFPKKITYQKDGEKLKATISGNGRSIDYFFEKLK